MIYDWISRFFPRATAGDLAPADTAHSLSPHFGSLCEDRPEFWEPAEVLQDETWRKLPSHHPCYDGYDIFDRA